MENKHAQVIAEGFQGSIPKSFLPFNPYAVGDKDWAINRLGAERLKTLCMQGPVGLVWSPAFGTDFPVEDINPFQAFYAAVARKVPGQKSTEAFQPENALSRYEAL